MSGVKGCKMPPRTAEHVAKWLVGRLTNGLPWHAPEVRAKISATCKRRGIQPPIPTPEHREWLRSRYRGSGSTNWKGGKSFVGKLIRESSFYAQWRSDVFRRDEWTCQTCGARGGAVRIQAHHIVPLSVLMDKYFVKTIEDAMHCQELWDTKNGVTLCTPCHNLTRKGFEHAR